MWVYIACWAVLAVACMASGLFLTCYAINGLADLWQSCMVELIAELEELNERV